jgi:hypothetical protein
MKTKIYNSFNDKFNNNYAFSTYIEFASFWFNMSRRTAQFYFPQFNELQKCASNSSEARKKLN